MVTQSGSVVLSMSMPRIELIRKFEHNCLSEKMDGRLMDRRRSIAEVTEIWTDEVFLDDEV